MNHRRKIQSAVLSRILQVALRDTMAFRRNCARNDRRTMLPKIGDIGWFPGDIQDLNAPSGGIGNELTH